MRHLLAAAIIAMTPSLAAAQEPIRLYAAGSLRAAMLDIADAFNRQSGVKVTATFGASGLLRERIEQGEPAEIFASADLGHPTTLSQAGKGGPVVVFARNRLCALARSDIGATPTTLLDRMLDPQVRLGTSTPKADPCGDYAWALFEKAEKLRPGAYANLDAKALKLVGGPNSPTPPTDRSLYALMMEAKQADLFLTYCTNASQAAKEVTSLRVVRGAGRAGGRCRLRDRRPYQGAARGRAIRVFRFIARRADDSRQSWVHARRPARSGQLIHGTIMKLSAHTALKGSRT
jgi:ABC-type molybdate transport system substrate-binding protein